MTDKEESFKQFAEQAQGMQGNQNWGLKYKYQQFSGQFSSVKYQMDGLESQLLANVVTALKDIKAPCELDNFLSRGAVVTALQLLVRIAKAEGVTK